MDQKIISLKRAKALRGGFRRRKKKMVFTNGCFDILHIGHVRYLQAAKRAGHVLVVGLNSDSSVRRLKGKERPLNGERERAGVLAALECVDHVVIFGEDTPECLIRTLLPDVLVKGSDWKRGTIVGEDIVEGNGGSVRRIRFEKGFSTTAIIEKIKRS
jgi:D-beta-D-heptose 7-phosphate kinase/D-beta-D-heptose 1-phosphate adenosyltransferase